MCNLYTITTNQAAVAALFRYQPVSRQLATDAGGLPRLSGSGDKRRRQ
jgi:hypothetical protein